jgi:hypothetical protein
MDGDGTQRLGSGWSGLTGSTGGTALLMLRNGHEW